MMITGTSIHWMLVIPLMMMMMSKSARIPLLNIQLGLLTTPLS